MNTETKRVDPKDVFFHLLSMVALYASAVSFLTIIFQCINIWLPDTLQWVGYVESRYGPLRFAVSALVVVFPVYFFSAKFLKKSYALSPEKSELRIRKWLVYFTLFIAALVIIGDLVALIHNFLQGELTLRFLLKVLAVLFVAGSTFGYYLQGLRNPASVSMKFFTVVVPAIVVAFLILGFYVAGAPSNQRKLQYDSRRIGDLQYLQSQISEYWRETGKLPKDLETLKDPLRGVTVPKDPETQGSYGYQTATGTAPTFELCADFSLPSDQKSETSAYGPYESQEYWLHEVGRHCFTRTIDPDFFKKDGTIVIPKTIDVR